MIKVMIMISIILFSISLYFLIKDYLAYKESNNANKQLIQEVIIKDATTKENSKQKESNKNKAEDKQGEIQIDWEKLKKINKDIIGWIRINGTNINYPILQDSNKIKYLKHSYNGRYNANGAIFTLNNNPFEDDITVIYGHNTRNGLMFSHLARYMELDFLKKHSSFNIDTKKKKYRATIFSCYSIGVETEENNIKLLNFEEEVNYYKNQSRYFIKDIGKIEKIVKLSTCSYLNNHTVPTNQRYYIVAKLEAIE